MNLTKIRIFFAMVAIPLIASCTGNSKMFSDSEIKPVSKKVQKSVVKSSSPSSKILAEAATKPKDRHSMPMYKVSERNRVVRTTAYTCSEADHLKYGSKNATGTLLRFSDKVRSAAADWSFYPVGTVFRMKGMQQLYVVDDYGSALEGAGTLDLYKPSQSAMRKWGLRNVEITVIKWGSFERSVELLKGRTGYSHCRKMLSNILRQRPDLKHVANH